MCVCVWGGVCLCVSPRTLNDTTNMNAKNSERGWKFRARLKTEWTTSKRSGGRYLVYTKYVALVVYTASKLSCMKATAPKNPKNIELYHYELRHSPWTKSRNFSRILNSQINSFLSSNRTWESENISMIASLPEFLFDFLRSLKVL